jgi:hypothetical protein
MPPGAPQDGAAGEVGHLQEHIGGRGVDLSRRATHDAGQADGAAGVGDHQVVWIQLALDAVQRDQRLPGKGLPDVDQRAGQQLDVVGVDRVADLDHDVVGGVHDVGDRTDARGVQPALQPRWGRRDGHVADAPAVESPAAVGRGDRDRHARVASRQRTGLRRMQLGAGQRGDVVGHAEDRQRIATVRVEIQLEDDVVQLQPVRQVGAQRCIAAEHPDAAVVVANAKLAGAGQHAVGLHSHEALAPDLDAPG